MIDDGIDFTKNLRGGLVFFKIVTKRGDGFHHEHGGRNALTGYVTYCDGDMVFVQNDMVKEIAADAFRGDKFGLDLI